MRLAEFQVDRYGPLPRITQECNGTLEVVYGPNESGKTLLLEALLKLVDPGIEGVMGGVNRVDESPQGHVVLETGDGETVLGDGTVLSDLAPIDPIHLRNIFVVRDSDLRLEDHHQFYDSVTEQIGDLHTSEIEAIQSALEDRGRLTPRNRNVSSAAGHNDAGTVRDEARRVAEEIREYVKETRTEASDELESDLVTARTERRRVEREAENLELAETAAEHDRLADRLETVERTTEALTDLADVSQADFEELQGLHQSIETDERHIAELETEIEELEEEIDEKHEAVGATEDEIQPLADRESEIDDLSRDLDADREQTDETTGAERSMRMARLVTGLGLGLGGLTSLWGVVQGSGQLLPGVLFLLVGLGGLAWYYLSQRKLAERERRRESLLRAARDAGLAVDDVSDIRPAIEGFRNDLSTKRERKQRLENEIEVTRAELENRREDLSTRRDSLSQNRERTDELLREAGVSDLEEYRELLGRTDDLEQERSKAAQSLEDAFGDPNGETFEERIEFWESELEAIVEDVDLEGVDPGEYDEERHEDLREELDRLEARIEELETDLDSHQRQIDGFGRRARELDTHPFVDEQVTLEAQTTDGLEQLAADLEGVADRIDRDARISKEALDIFDDLHDEEEEKITDLFEPDGRATEVFQRITDGRYQQVSYDPDARTLEVHRDTGQVLATSELSHGTREQLYLAARVALAEQLLDAEPGFFLMDDAFLPADRERLTEGFRVLQELADEGWQVLYLTAKEEVGVDMVDEFGLERRELDPLP